MLLPCTERTDTRRDAEMQTWHICARKTVKTLVLPRTPAKIISLCSTHRIQLENPVCYTAPTLTLPSASVIGSQNQKFLPHWYVLANLWISTGRLQRSWSWLWWILNAYRIPPRKIKLPGTSRNISGTGCVCTWLPPSTFTRFRFGDLNPMPF